MLPTKMQDDDEIREKKKRKKKEIIDGKSVFKQYLPFVLTPEERNNLSKLLDPTLPRIHSINTHENETIVVSEFINGAVLSPPDFDLNAKGLYLLKRIASGVQYLHEESIYHGRLKPSNIILTTKSVKLVGFYVLNRKLEINDDEYVAPEKRNGKKLTTQEEQCADIFSFGVILSQIIKDKKINTDILSNLQQLASFCMKENASERPSSSHVIEEIGKNYQKAVILEKPQISIQAVQELLTKCSESYKQHQFEKCIEEAFKLVKIIEDKLQYLENDDKILYNSILFHAKKLIGLSYSEKGIYKESVTQMEECLQLVKDHPELEDDEQIFYSSHLNLAAVYNKINQVDKVIELCEKALHKLLQSNIKDKRKIEGIIYSNLGSAYEIKKDFKKAEEFYTKRYELAMNDNDTQGLRIIYNKFACLYIAMQQYTKVIEYCQKLISISQPNSIHLGMCYGNAGIAYMKLGYYEMAEKCFQLELDIAQTIQNRAEEANARHRMGLLHYRKGEREKGDQDFRQALQIAKEIGAVRIEEQILRNIELKKEEDNEYGQLEAIASKFSDECNHFIFENIEKNKGPGVNGKCTEITVRKYQPIKVEENFAIFDFLPKMENVQPNYDELLKQLKISIKGQYQTVDWFDIHRTFGTCYEAREGTNIQLVVRNESNLDCTIFIVYVNFEGNIITLSFVDGYQRVIAKRSMKHLTIGALERVPDQSKKVCLVKTFAQFHGFTPFLVCTQPIIVTQ